MFKIIIEQHTEWFTSLFHYSASIISPYSISSCPPLGPQHQCGKSNSTSIFRPPKFLIFGGPRNSYEFRGIENFIKFSNVQEIYKISFNLLFFGSIGYTIYTIYNCRLSNIVYTINRKNYLTGRQI